ncbi:hypothetical protein BC830DRAFT_1164857 [Chytriomyces sp. MP71]|nr:hypothetical protein BC830DRAFT_1164857 [Chytriomyces sp. MP71]
MENTYRLSHLPPEILDPIATYLDTRSLLRLGHTVRHYRAISSALFSVGTLYFTFRNFERCRTLLWPHPRLELRIDTLEARTALESLLVFSRRCGGVADLRPLRLEDLRDFIALMPSNMRVNVSFAYLQTEANCIRALETLVEAKTWVQALRWERKYSFHDEAETSLKLLLSRMQQVRHIELSSSIRSVLDSLSVINGLKSVAFLYPDTIHGQDLLQFPTQLTCIFYVTVTSQPIVWILSLASYLRSLSINAIQFRLTCLRKDLRKLRDPFLAVQNLVEKASWNQTILKEDIIIWTRKHE